jgi:hypothetical protein
MVAQCAIRAHESRLEGIPPHVGCSCGIYALKDLGQELQGYVRPTPTSPNRYGAIGEPGVVPAVTQLAMWGKVIQGTTGYKAQYAYPIMIYVPDKETAEVIGDAYGVPTNYEQWADIGKALKMVQQSDAIKRGAIIDPKIKAEIDAMSLEEKLKLARMAKYQGEYHRWYNERKQTIKKVEYWEAMVKRAPVELAKMKAKLRSVEASKPIRNY